VDYFDDIVSLDLYVVLTFPESLLIIMVSHYLIRIKINITKERRLSWGPKVIYEP